MTKFTLNTTSLLLLTLFSTGALANDPWAGLDAPDTGSGVSPIQDDAPVQNTAPVEIMQEDSRPAAMDEEPMPQEQDELVVTPDETEVIQQQGDVLNMAPTQGQPAPVTLLEFPRRGMTTDKVENEMGRPNEIIPAIGQPPISRWVYDDRTVYFEYSTVLHVVAK